MIMSTDGCQPIAYHPFYENIHYYYQFLYLFLSICLNYRILFTIWVSQRHFYSNQSFYNLYSLDVSFAILSMSLDLIFTRNWLFFPQFCDKLSIFFGGSQVFMRIYYCSVNYCKAIKSIIHIFIAVNRMCCVLYPVTYSQGWRDKMWLMKLIILLAPFLVIWNLVISENYVVFANGGFAVTYERKVSWASLSMMQFTLIIITVIITMSTTVVTFYKMSHMKKRIKASERSLCIAAGLISVGFLFEAFSQSLFAFFKGEEWMMNIILYVQFTSWDLLTIGSSLVLLLVSHQFRAHVFHLPSRRTQRVSSINNTITQHPYPHQTLNRIFMRLYFCTLGYCKAAKTVVHIFIAVNRMCCVLYPITYSQSWSRKMSILIVIVMLSPFLIIWNIVISENYIMFHPNGGFGVAYHRKVEWASLSMMQFTLIIITVIITMSTTVVTFYKMSPRLKSSERSLCITAALVSFGFLLEAVTQSIFAFYRDKWWVMGNIMYIQSASWDFLTVFSPCALLLLSRQFREHALPFRKIASSSTVF